MYPIYLMSTIAIVLITLLQLQICTSQRAAQIMGGEQHMQLQSLIASLPGLQTQDRRLSADMSFEDYYLWNDEYTFAQRQRDLLAHLHKDPVLLSMREELSIPLLQSNATPLYVTNNFGESYKVTQISMAEYLSKSIVKANNSSSGNVTVIMNPNPEELLKVMKGVCISTEPDGKYWIFEVCNRDQIYQYHMEHDPSNPSNVVRSPNWSLGTYQSTSIKRENKRNSSSRVIKIIDKFEDGQFCDETGRGRNTRVVFECCESKSDKRNQDFPINTVPIIRIESVAEHSICSYRIRVCMEVMCLPKLAQEPNSVALNEISDNSLSLTSNDDNSIQEFIKNFQRSCLYRQEEWWTYEWCMTEGLRQYHSQISTVQLSDGTMKQKKEIMSEFSLGKANSKVFDDIELLKESITHPEESTVDKVISTFGLPLISVSARGKVSSMDSKVSKMRFEYVNGTICELTGLPRSTTIEITCGAKDEFLDIVEDHTCHYVVRIQSKEICKLSKFKSDGTRFAYLELQKSELSGISHLALESQFRQGQIIECNYNSQSWRRGVIAFIHAPSQISKSVTELYDIKFLDSVNLYLSPLEDRQDYYSFVPSSFLRPIVSWDKGDRVEVNYRDEGVYYAAKIQFYHKEEDSYDVLYHDETSQKHVPSKLIRLPEIAAIAESVEEETSISDQVLVSSPPRDARESKHQPSATSIFQFRLGDRVRSNHQGGSSRSWAYGLISRVDKSGTMYDIDFDDGDQEVNVHYSSIKSSSYPYSFDWRVGDACEGNWENRGIWYRCKVINVRSQNSIDVQYDEDKVIEKSMPRVLLRRANHLTFLQLRKRESNKKIVSENNQIK